MISKNQFFNAFLLTCTFSLEVSTSSNPLIALSVKEIQESINEVTNTLYDLLNKPETELRSEKTINLFRQLEDLYRRSHSAHNGINAKIVDMRNDWSQMYYMPTVSTILDERFLKLFEYTVSVNGFFEEFQKLVKMPRGYNNKRKKRFALKMTDPDSNSLSDILHKINELWFNHNFQNPSTVYLLAKNIGSVAVDGGMLKSSHQLLFDFLRSILYVEIEGYIIQSYSYRYLEKIKEVNATYDLIELENQFLTNIDTAIAIFKNIMASTLKEVRMTYPNQHIEGTTYEELKFVFQRFITNELNINQQDQCRKECKDYTNYLGSHECTHSKNFCLQSLCKGRLHECHEATVDDGGCPSKMFNFPCKETEHMRSLTVCPTTNYRSDAFSHRRFDYVIFNGTTRGTFGIECSVKPITVDTNYKFYLSVPASNPCDTCGCICEEFSDLSERYFSLDPVKANTAENHVITGTRLVKLNNTIFIQIQEGQLLPYGEIDQNTVHWVEINMNPERVYQVEWENRREVELNDLMAPQGFVITEISFGITEAKNHQQRLALKAVSQAIDFYSGKLKWLPEKIQNTNLDSYEIYIPVPDIPIRYTFGDVIYSQNNDFVRFGVSDFTEDFGQSTVPFIDVREVTTDPPVPMSGVGLYLSRRSNDAGFLSIKLFTYDYDKYLKAKSIDS